MLYFSFIYLVPCHKGGGKYLITKNNVTAEIEKEKSEERKRK